MSNLSLVDIEDPAALLAYLRERGRIRPDETPQTRVLAGGVSNKTVLVERASGEAWVLKQALFKLRTQAEWFSDPARIRREADALRWLPRIAPPGTITPLVFEDRDQYLLAMVAVPQPHENWKSMLLAGRVEGPQNLGYVASFGALLCQIHARSAETPEDLVTAFGDRSFFESLRLEPYYAYAARQAPQAAEFLAALIARTRARQLTLVHGDYSPKNVLIHEGRLVLLDHEVIHFGDPAFDVGFAMAHFLSKANHLSPKRAAFANAALLFWNSYTAGIWHAPWTAQLEEHAVRNALGCALARVAGRSPLEYLDEHQRRRQQAAVLDLMRADDPPRSMADLIARFVERL